MALRRSLPENATLADLRRTYADLLEKLRPYAPDVRPIQDRRRSISIGMFLSFRSVR